MRSPAHATLASLLLAVDSSISECLRPRSGELASVAGCGDAGRLSACLSSTPELLDDVLASTRECLLMAGCPAAEAGEEASRLLVGCDTSRSDLRKRQAPLVPAPAAAATTLDAASQMWAARFTGADTQETMCYRPSLVQVTLCTAAAQCFETTVTRPVCKDGLLCKPAPDGKPGCMVRDDSFGVAGIVVMVLLAGSFGLTFLGAFVMCARDHRRRKKLRRAAEIREMAWEQKMAAAKDQASASLTAPLMGDDGIKGDELDAGYAADGADGADGVHGVHEGQNPFASIHPALR